MVVDISTPLIFDPPCRKFHRRHGARIYRGINVAWNGPAFTPSPIENEFRETETGLKLGFLGVLHNFGGRFFEKLLNNEYDYLWCSSSTALLITDLNHIMKLKSKKFESINWWIVVYIIKYRYRDKLKFSILISTIRYDISISKRYIAGMKLDSPQRVWINQETTWNTLKTTVLVLTIFCIEI